MFGPAVLQSGLATVKGTVASDHALPKLLLPLPTRCVLQATLDLRVVGGDTDAGSAGCIAPDSVDQQSASHIGAHGGSSLACDSH